MWKQLVELGNGVFALVRKTEQHEADIKDLREELRGVRQDIKEINQKLDRLTEALQRVSFEHQRDRENAETQRERYRDRALVHASNPNMPSGMVSSGVPASLSPMAAPR